MGFVAALPALGKALLASKAMMGLTVASGALGALQAYGQGKYQSKLFELQAKDETLASKQATIDGRSQALAIRQEANIHLGNILAKQALLGQLGSPSGEAFYEDSKETFEFNREGVRFAAGAEALGHDARSAMYGSMAKDAKAKGLQSAVGTLFKTAVSLTGQYGDMQEMKSEFGGASRDLAPMAKTPKMNKYLGIKKGTKRPLGVL